MSDDRQQINMKLEEYKLLREEMCDEIRTQDSLINICLTSVTAVLAFAFSQHLSIVLLAAYPIIFFLLFRFIRHRERVMHIAGYLIAYLEPIIGFTWETHGDFAHEPKGDKVYKEFLKTPHYHFLGSIGGNDIVRLDSDRLYQSSNCDSCNSSSIHYPCYCDCWDIQFINYLGKSK